MSHDPTIHPLDADDVQRLDNVLTDTRADGHTRRALLGRAALAAAAMGAVPTGLAFAKGEDAKTILDTAATAEALAVTYLTGVITTIKDPQVQQFADVLKAANAAEYAHYEALTSLGAKPLTKRFWAPDALFETKKDHIFDVIETLEEVFINAYLVGATAFAKAGMDKEARYAGQILAVEAQHRTLARYAQGKLPDNLGFERFRVDSIDAIVKQITGLGIGLGQKGSKAGKFYDFPGRPPAAAVTKIHNTKLS